MRRGTRYALRASLGQPRRVSSRGMGASTPMLTPQPPRRRRSQQGWDSRTSKQPNSRTSIRAIAALGPSCAARGACAREVGPSEAKARVDVLAPLPLWMRRGAQGLADQGSRLSERSEFERDPAQPEHHRLPRRAAAGTQTVGSPFLWSLSFGDAKERDSPAGRLPASALNPGMQSRQHTIESASLNSKYPFGLSLSKPRAALRQAQRERLK